MSNLLDRNDLSDVEFEDALFNLSDVELIFYADANCNHCLGLGYTTEYQSHPYGDTFATEKVTELCDCLWRKRGREAQS